MSSSELHPWNWYVPQDAKCVIVGTFPPTVHRRSFDFFYPNRNNFFWPMMAHIAGCELQSFSGEEAVTERKALLALLQVGVADMGKEIERKKEHDSSDANLLIIRYMPILRMLEEHPSIHTLIFTSSTGKASAFRWFQAYLAENGMECASPQGPRPVYREWSWAGKVYRLVFLYSTSPRIRATISVPALTELFRKEIGPQSTEIVM